MNESANRPNGGFMQVRAWVWCVVFLCFAVLCVLILTGSLEDRGEEKLPGGPGAVESIAPKQPSPEPDSKSVPFPDPPVFKVDSPVSQEPNFEEAVFQTDLTVILLSRPRLGQISVEKYDSAGNPTGEPLKSGTQVQIPDPDWPGEKIYFRIP